MSLRSSSIPRIGVARRAGALPVVAAALLCTAALGPGELAAQVPPGSVVVASFAEPSSVPGLGGLFLFDPATSVVTTVAGMPCELTGACPDPLTPWTGSDWVLRLPSSGRVLVNGPNWINQSVSVYALTLTGATVTGVATYPIATFNNLNGLGNPAAALLADERVLLAIDPTSMGAPGLLGGALLGILDPSLPPAAPGALTVVPVSPIPPGRTNALVVDNDLGVAYVAFANGPIYSIPIPGGGAPTLVTTIPGVINAMALEPDGKLLVGGRMSTLARLWRVEPSTGGVTTFLQSFGAGGINALRIDPVSGALYMVLPSGAGSVWVGTLSPMTTSGIVTTVTTGPAGGWGVCSGLDMSASLETYGASSGALPAARWRLAPSPGGAPIIGNASFTLTNSTIPPAPMSWCLLGLGRIQVSVPTVPVLELWVNPLVSLPMASGGPSQPSTLAFPIPMTPTLSGLEFFAQCVHLTGTSISASSALHVTVQ